MLEGSLDRLRNLLDAIRTRLWLIPALMSIGAAFLARMIVRFDKEGGLRDFDAWWYFGGEADTARELLATLLSGMITMTSLVISITMVVLSLAANQLGPRLIWNFIRDRQIQFVIGLFFGTIFFILVVGRSISSDDVPGIAVTVSTALVGLCLFALLFHVHKVASSIVADTVIDEVASSLLHAISGMPEVGHGRHVRMGGDEPTLLPKLTELAIGRSGYVQVIEYRKLAKLATRHGLGIRVHVRAGHFVLAHGRHVEVRHDGELDDAVRKKVIDAFLIGSQRTATQDIEYSIRQLVEIAVRALSPSVNDPFTAITVVHRLGEAVELIAGKALPERELWSDETGNLRVVGDASSFKGMVDAAFNQIRQAATSGGNVAVLISMCRLIGQLGEALGDETQAEVLREQLDLLSHAAERAIPEPRDRSDFAAALEQARNSFMRPAG